mgnify:CR=1 FL=1
MNNNTVHYEDALMVKAVWYYYFENMTQTVIAGRLGISQVQVSRLEKNALKSMQGYLRT